MSASIAVHLLALASNSSDGDPVAGCVGTLMVLGSIVAVGIAISKNSARRAATMRNQLPLAQCPRCFQQYWTVACPRCAWPRNQPFHRPMPQQMPQHYAPPPQQIVHHVHTIERQIVLVRCRYCSTQTRVDAGKCANCGAANFS